MILIQATDTIEDVVRGDPETVQIFYRYGLLCIACGEPVWGTIEENAKCYRVKDRAGLLRELNERAHRTAPRTNA